MIRSTMPGLPENLVEELSGELPSRCENCGGTCLEPFLVPRQTRLWRCAKCGLYQGGRPPRSSYYELGYHDAYRHSLPRKIRTAQVRLCRLASALEDDAPSLLDIGCSIGATVTAAERRGWPAYGVDVSHTAVDFCRRQGLNCRHYDGQQLPYADGSFEALTAWHVIEHVADVEQTLREWYRVLRPGGVVMLETPNAECWKARLLGARYRKFWPPGHTYTFGCDNLQSLFLRVGFQALPVPRIAIPRHVGPSMSMFAVAHQCYLAVSQSTGFGKAFQLLARRPREARCGADRGSELSSNVAV